MSRALPLLLLLALLATAAPAAAAPSKTVRVFAMGPKLDLGWLESRETYRGKMLALFDRRLRGPDRPAIQTGTDDAASHLRGPSDAARPVETARDLVTFPEDIGLFAALTGPRAAAARGSGSLAGAIGTLVGAYAPQNAYYAERYPALTQRVPQTRLLTLALTDTFARTVVETYAELADRYDVWLSTGVIMAQDWRVVCTDREAFNAATPTRLPGGVRCEAEDPGAVARLRDPAEPTRDYAYEATTDKPSTQALLFDPDGRLVSKQVKAYLVPVELGAPEGQVALDLVPGAVSDGLSAVRTPVGTLGFVTSKDAWMPDLMQKLDQQHVDLLVQPEFFVGNLVGGPGMWNPDVLLASGYSDVLRHPSIEAMVMPQLVGNVFDFSADHQQLVAVKPRAARGTGGHMVGQPDHRGITGVSPWVVPDELPGEDATRRRERLAAAGRTLAPGSGVRCADPSRPGPCENGHVEDVLFRDVLIERAPALRPFRGPRARTRFSRSRPAARSRNPQRNAAVALRGRRGVLAFEERRAGRDQVLLARTTDGGRTWSRPVRPTGRPAGAHDEWWPAVALGPDGVVTLAWVDASSGRPRAWLARSRDGGRRFGAPVALDPAPPKEVAQWRPALAQGAGDVVHAVWVDERGAQDDGGLPQAGAFYARIRDGVPEAGRRLDGGRPRPLATKLDNAWAPSVAVRGGQVLVAWLDFANYDWDVVARQSEDGGAQFGPEVPVNDTPEDDPATEGDEQEEALNDTPSAALLPAGPRVAWTDWRKRSRSRAPTHANYDTYVAAPGGANVQVDPHGDRQLATFAPSTCVSRGRLLVAYQDASRGQNDVRLTDVGDGSRAARSFRVDDAGRRGGNAWRPHLACSGARQLVAWEDERDGPPNVYTAVRGTRLAR